MRGEFYTELDIADLIKQGRNSLQLNEGDRLTDLARDLANKEGLKLLGPHESSSQVARQAASVRYAQESNSNQSSSPNNSSNSGKLHQRIKGAVITKLGGSVDPVLLDRVIRRVLDQMGLD